MKFLIALAASIVTAHAQTADYQVSGVVIDHLTQKPLNHILVELVQNGKNGNEASVLTQADGKFIFLHVPPGKYRLTAEKRGQQPFAFQADGGFATAVVVDGKQKTENLIFAMPTEASINGGVVADDGEPVRNAQIMLYRESLNDGELKTMQVKSAMTNSAGQFHLGRLQEGKYYLAAEAIPWYTTGTNNVVYPITFFGDTTNGASARPIQLPEGGTADAQITLRAAPAIRVKIAPGFRYSGLFVAGPGDSRIGVSAGIWGAGQRMAIRGGGRFYAPNAAPLRASEEGQMELGNIAAGRYEIIGENGKMITIDLANGGVIANEPAQLGSITGHVRFEGVKPGENLAVLLNHTQNGGLRAPVSADGTFKFERVAAGSYPLFLSEADLGISAVTVRGARIVHDRIEIPSGAAAELTIKAVAPESLTHIDGFAAKDNSNVAGALVLLLPEDSDSFQRLRRDQSDSDGSFSMRNVQPGRYLLVAIDNGKDLGYKDDAVMKPYLKGGVAITAPLKSNDPIKVPVQTRLR